MDIHDPSPATCSALEVLHIMRLEARTIERCHADKNLDVEATAGKIADYGLKLHVLLGGNAPDTYGEAVVMPDFPYCEPHEYDNRTREENKKWLLNAWLPNN